MPRIALRALLASIAVSAGSLLWAVGDASTSFQIFVPANNDPVGRDSALIVTNVSPTTSIINIEDTAEDGDTDDSRSSVTLATGQSQVVFIKDGAVNDDASGKWDGDYFRITATEPVVSQIATRSDWQWDFVPADNKTMRGQSFYVYAPSTSFSDRDIDVFAYEPDTEVSLLRISTTAQNATGLTTVDTANPVEVFKATLQPGEDLIVSKNLGVDVLKPGQTYWIRATRPVTCMSGSLVGNARDGMGFVPSQNGSSTGELFYFFMPTDYTGERELRLIAWENGTTASFQGWDATSRTWKTVQTFNMNAQGRGDWVEPSNNPYRLYRIVTNTGKPVSVLIESWMEAGGLSVTKDDTSFASARSGYGAGKQFLFYMPPPGEQGRVAGFGSQQTHVFLYGHVNGTTWTVRDTDTSGAVIQRSGTLNKGQYTRVSISSSLYNTMNKPAEGRRPYVSVEASNLITAQASNFNDNWMTYVPSVTLPNPVLTATSIDQRVSVGTPARFRFDATNSGASSLSTAQITITLDPAVQYVSSIVNGIAIGAPTVTTETATGRNVLTWTGLTIPQGATIGGEITVSARARRASGTRVRNGDFVLHTVNIRGNGFGTPAAQGGESELFTAQASAASTVLDTNQTVLNYFSAQTSGTGVAVRWQTATEPDVDLFRVFRASAAAGPFTLLSNGTVVGTGDASSGGTYALFDPTATGSTTWYYRLDLVDTENAVRSFGPIAVSTVDTTPPDTPVISTITTTDGRVDLTYTGGNRDGDLKAYELFRSLSPAGPFVSLGSQSINPTGTDTTVLNGISYYYRVQAIDRAGNRSSLSNIATANLPTTVSQSWSIAYEDQLGPTANDWDYNDFVVIQKADETFQSGGVRSVAIRLEAAARGASYNNQFWQKVRGKGAWSGTLSLYADRNTSVPFSTRSISGSGEANILVWNLTRDALPPFEDTNFTNTQSRQTTATLGQVALLQITFDTPSLNPSNTRHRMPYDPYLKSNLGEIHLVRENYPQSTEVVAFDKNRTSPLYGFNADYALAVPTGEWYWPGESRRVWNAYGTFANWLLSGKTASTNWWSPAGRVISETWNRYIYNRNAALILANDPTPDSSLQLVDTVSTTVVGPLGVVASIGAGYELPQGIIWGGGDIVKVVDAADASTTVAANSARSRAVLAPLTPGGPQMLLTAEERYETTAAIEARNWPAATLAWRVETGAAVKSALVLAALDGPSAPLTVIAVADDGKLYAINANGSLRFPAVSLGTQDLPSKSILAMPTPVVADVDGNGSLDIVAASTNGQVTVLSSTNGLPLSGWPKTTNGAIVASPIILRDAVGGEARILAATQNGLVYGWSPRGLLKTGFPIDLGAAIEASPARWDASTSIWATGNGDVVLITADGQRRTNWTANIGAAVKAAPVVADIDGDGSTDVIVAAENGTIDAWSANGNRVDGFPISAAGAIHSTPVVVDLDLDGRLDLWVATANGNLYRWTSPAPTPLGFSDRAPWSSIGGSITGQASAEQFTVPTIPSASVTNWNQY